MVAVGHRRLSFLVIEMSLQVFYWSTCSIGSEMLFDSTFEDELKSSFGAEQPAPVVKSQGVTCSMTQFWMS
jgi:hypothetical protein